MTSRLLATDLAEGLSSSSPAEWVSVDAQRRSRSFATSAAFYSGVRWRLEHHVREPVGAVRPARHWPYLGGGTSTPESRKGRDVLRASAPKPAPSPASARARQMPVKPAVVHGPNLMLADFVVLCLSPGEAETFVRRIFGAVFSGLEPQTTLRAMNAKTRLGKRVPA